MMVSSPERSGGQNQYIEQSTIEKASDERLASLITHIQSNLTDDYSIDSVASYCAMSTRSFSRCFKANQGDSFKLSLNNIRLNRSQELLESTALPITQISEHAGFSSEQIFRKHFKRRFDKTPKAWRALFRGHHRQ
jgi:transcriptional regulator GlxA family with amidase domain